MQELSSFIITKSNYGSIYDMVVEMIMACIMHLLYISWTYSMHAPSICELQQKQHHCPLKVLNKTTFIWLSLPLTPWATNSQLLSEIKDQ